MNRKQKIIVSVTGIFIVLLALVGITFAYFLTRIQGNTNTTSITATTADLRLVYGDGNGNISATSIEPGWTNDGDSGRPEPKTFTVTNEGNTTVEGFKIYLEDVRNSLARKEDLIYTITCENITPGATSTECEDFDIVENEVTSEDELIFPSVMSIIATDTLEPATEDTNAEIHTYTITVTYKNLTDTDQSIDMGKVFSAKVNIYDAKTKFLATEIMKNVMDNSDLAETTGSKYVKPDQLGIAENTTIPGQAISLASEKLVSYTFDDDGTSFYYRGNVEDNYVKFAGMCWRIVRIRGDGSILLTLAADHITCSGINDTYYQGAAFIGTGFYSEKNYGLEYDKNIENPSSVKYILNEWFNQKLVDSISHLNSTSMCIGNITDRYSLDGVLVDDSYTGSYVFYTHVRLMAMNGQTPYSTLKCDEYSNKTSDSKIFLLTVDEIVFAGGLLTANNTNFYLNSNAQTGNWYTISARGYDSNRGTYNVYSVDNNGNIFYYGASSSLSIRPAIILKYDTTILEGGNGEMATPYVIG